MEAGRIGGGLDKVVFTGGGILTRVRMDCGRCIFGGVHESAIEMTDKA